MKPAFTIRCLALSAGLVTVTAGAADLKDYLSPAAAAVEKKVIEWRHDIHANPELGNREYRTAGIIAEHLEKLGMEVTAEVAHTGVVGILRGGKKGPVVALRADMDALPVTEQTGLPFASTVSTEYNGQQTGVMHACGHDAHVAILLGVAEVLAGIRDGLPGTVKFIFQPAEEGPPPGEEGGAALMVKEGVLAGPDAPEAIFGLHVWPEPAGQILVRPDGMMASADEFEITIRGRQTHGSRPWSGVDPVTIAGQVITALQTIVSRQLDVTVAPAVVSVGSIHGGIRWNIIPDEVVMEGTIRTFDSGMREDLWARIRHTVKNVAEASGATAVVKIQNNAPVTVNDPALLERMLPSLRWAAGEDSVRTIRPVMGAEDFSYYANEIPALFFFLGINREGVSPAEAAPNHSPLFHVNDDALETGVRALSALVVDYLAGNERKR